MKKLTVKEQNFAELCVSLGNQTEAYRQAYDPSKKDADWIRAEASKLVSQPNITLTIQNLRDKLSEDKHIDRQTLIDYHHEMIEAWKELWELGKQKPLPKEDKNRFYLLKELVKGSDYRGSIDAIAKLKGLNEPEKIEHNHTIKTHQTNWG